MREAKKHGFVNLLFAKLIHKYKIIIYLYRTFSIFLKIHRNDFWNCFKFIHAAINFYSHHKKKFLSSLGINK